MKNRIILALALCCATFINAQYNTPWTTNVSNSINNGYIGIGTSPTANTNTVKPRYNFQVHGVADYIYNGSQTSIMEDSSSQGNGNYQKNYVFPINFGKTARIGITNSVTGIGESDGGLIMMAQKNLSFSNRENGNLTISIPRATMKFDNSSGRVSIGGVSSGNEYGKFNVYTSDNGMSIRVNNALKYALRLKVSTDNSNVIEAFGSDNSVPNFQVTGAGNVYARRYITTLNPFPDYVFQPDYELRTFSELRTFINTHKHLPNMPTASEVDENGADIGEINRLLVEKVEELTLYVLELEERLSAAESNDTNNESLQKRIERLEELILELSK